MSAHESVVSDAEAFLADAYDRGGRAWDCIDHARRVSAILRAQHCDDDVVAAGALHDVVTAGCATATEVRERFGARIGDLVCCLTEDRGIADYRERKRALRHAVRAGGLGALLILGAEALERMRTIDENDLPVGALTLEHHQQTARMLVAAGIRSYTSTNCRRAWRLRRSGARTGRSQSVGASP